MLGVKETRLIFFVILLITIKLYIDHRKEEYRGEYNIKGDYKYISQVKRDIVKFATIIISFILVYGTLPLTINDLLTNWIGNLFVLCSSIMIYYELLEPYLFNKIRLM
jgi:hypothetical protein